MEGSKAEFNMNYTFVNNGALPLRFMLCVVAPVDLGVAPAEVQDWISSVTPDTNCVNRQNTRRKFHVSMPDPPPGIRS